MDDSEKLAELLSELDKLADLMADSTELRVKETPVVKTLNELLDKYA